MTFLNRIERVLAPFALPGIIRYVVGLNALTYILAVISPGYLEVLNLQPELVLQGQIWRLFTWIFIPPTMSPIFILFALWLLWIYGEALEAQWGTFRLNVFYFTGVVACTVAAMFVGGSVAFNGLLNASIFFAFATLNPDFRLLLFFILPVKVKWLALFMLGMILLSALGGTWTLRVAMLVCFSNYLLFFGPEFFRKTTEARKTAVRRRKFEAAATSDETLHRCHVCQRTEVTNPELEFRVAADGNEYCNDHLPKRV